MSTASSATNTSSCCAANKLEMSLRNVALLNTKGIHALVMGRKHFVPRSLQAFKTALEDMDKVCQLQRQQESSSSSCSLCSSNTATKTSLDENYLEAFNSSPVARLDAQQDSFYVYNRAVFFKPLSDTSSIGLTFYTAILQFNMALAHHVKAKTTMTGGKKSLQRAVKYYKLCLKSLREVGVCGAMADRPPYPGGGESLIYLRLAALNNLSHVHAMAGDYGKVNETLARVFRFTVAQRPTLFVSQQQQSLEMEEDCSLQHNNTNGVVVGRRRATSSMNSAFVNEVLLNVMVSGQPVVGAGAA